MAKFEIKHRWNGSVLFTAELSAEYDGATDSVKMGAAVKLAISARANLAGANLAGANLADANLADAYLADAYLADAYLARANLARANLAGANLADANLADANLADANLARANLAGANLAGANLADAKFGEGVTATKPPLQLYGLYWPVTIFDAHIRIGCQLHATGEWEEFDDGEIRDMASNALEFWRGNKAVIIALAKHHQAGIEQQKEAA